MYKLTVQNTVEERILELQEKKRLLALHAIEGGAKKNKDGLKLSLQELLNLFKPRHDYDDDGHDQFVDGAQVEDDMDNVMRGLADFRKKKVPVEKKREDPVYGRRW